MPRIEEYNAPVTKLLPNNEGFSAYETAGRRVGPLYNEAATAAATKGKLDSQALKNNAWPLEVLAAAQQRAQDLTALRQQRAADAAKGGVNFRVIDPQQKNARTWGEMSNGAPNLAAMTRDITGGTPDKKPGGGRLIDGGTGNIITDAGTTGGFATPNTEDEQYRQSKFNALTDYLTGPQFIAPPGQQYTPQGVSTDWGILQRNAEQASYNDPQPGGFGSRTEAPSSWQQYIPSFGDGGAPEANQGQAVAESTASGPF